MLRERPVRIGVGGPVGTGKTALVAALCRALGPEIELAVVTNDIYTDEDAEFLRRAGVLDTARIIAVCGQQPVCTAMMRAVSSTPARRRNSASSSV